MTPSLGCRKPLIKLKTVVLPAPLGPMMKRISPSFIASETLLTALRPPKRLVTFSISRMGVIAQLRLRLVVVWRPWVVLFACENDVAIRRQCLPAGTALLRRSRRRRSEDGFPGRHS